MRHTNRGFGDLAGGVGVRIGSKRLELNPDIPLGRQSSLQYRTVGTNAIILLLEPFQGKPCAHVGYPGLAPETRIVRISVYTGTIRSCFVNGQHRDVGGPTAGHSGPPNNGECPRMQPWWRRIQRNHTRKSRRGCGIAEDMPMKSFPGTVNLISGSHGTLLNNP